MLGGPEEIVHGAVASFLLPESERLHHGGAFAACLRGTRRHREFPSTGSCLSTCYKIKLTLMLAAAASGQVLADTAWAGRPVRLWDQTLQTLFGGVRPFAIAIKMIVAFVC